MSRFSEYIAFKIATFPNAEHARYLASIHEPVTVADNFDFYDANWISSDAQLDSDLIRSVADNLNNEMASYAATAGARTAVAWYLIDLFFWMIDHNLAAHKRLSESDGRYYQIISDVRAVIRASGVFKNEKVGQATGAEESGQSAQATANAAERDEAARAV